MLHKFYILDLGGGGFDCFRVPSLLMADCQSNNLPCVTTDCPLLAEVGLGVKSPEKSPVSVSPTTLQSPRGVVMYLRSGSGRAWERKAGVFEQAEVVVASAVNEHWCPLLSSLSLFWVGVSLFFRCLHV